jgi:drug/metabolite transporter (DMT)-like permease
MHTPLTLRTAAILVVPPLMWAGNAVVGRLAGPLVPPVTLNFLRWAIAFLVLLPLAAWVLRPGGPLQTHWRRYALLGLLSVGLYNALQYLALKTSTPVNVTLVGASMPAFTLVIGALFFGQALALRSMLGALLSILGVGVVLAHGDITRLAQVQFVIGDLYMLVATATWAWYSWLLTRTDQDPPGLRADWAAFLMVQVVPGLAWAGVFAGAEWALADPPAIQWGGPLAATLVFVALGPAVLAYRAWGLGVQRVGPGIAGIFSNLTPLFAALMSAAFLGEPPQWHHIVAFGLIVSGIVVSSRKPG